MLSVMDKNALSDFIHHRGGPKSVSLSAETHLFYFHESDWRKSPVILVNKNGNHQRVMREPDGNYRLIKTWNSLYDVEQWMIQFITRHSAEEVVAAITAGPGEGKRERLSLFPKEAFTGRGRKAVWRQHIIDVWFDMKAGTFKLVRQPSEECPNGARSLDYQGKPWESEQAVNWCMANLTDAPTFVKAVENPFERERVLEAAMADLEDNPLWGAF